MAYPGKNKFIVLVEILLLAIIQVSVHASEINCFATAEVERIEPNTGVGPLQVSFKIYITNTTNKDIRFPTAGYASRGGETPDSVSEKLMWFFSRGPKSGTFIIPAESELNIVSLKKDEVALIEWKRTVQSFKKLQEITAMVSVSDDFAKRFHLWTGELVISNVTVHWGPGTNEPTSQP